MGYGTLSSAEMLRREMVPVSAAELCELRPRSEAAAAPAGGRDLARPGILKKSVMIRDGELARDGEAATESTLVGDIVV